MWVCIVASASMMRSVSSLKMSSQGTPAFDPSQSPSVYGKRGTPAVRRAGKSDQAPRVLKPHARTRLSVSRAQAWSFALWRKLAYSG